MPKNLRKKLCLYFRETTSFIFLIVISGHFFISRGKEVLEGFSLIGASQWLKVAQKADCMLVAIMKFGFYFLFAEDHCHNCMQKLAEYIPIQMTDSIRQELQHSHSLLLTEESQLKDTEQNVPLQDIVVNVSPTHGTTSVAELAQCVLIPDNQLPLAHQKSTWSAEDLSSYIRLCLLDQHFPAFVEDVEKQLKKIIDS
uniref:REC114 meiotic recombination protein n=1 Tax=Laticauda laticaudata TaxID=8630 RepID=A0A8C5SNG3_LATLA